MFKVGYELWTGITNMIIVIVSIFSYINTKDKNFKRFFYLMIIDGLLGFSIHTFNIGSSATNILWYVLAFFFTFTINQLLLIIIDNKKFQFKHSIILSIILYIVIFIERLLKIEFLYTFIFYALIILLISLIKTIKDKNYYILLGIIFQFIGGVLLLMRVKFLFLDYNGIYHLFMVLTLISFYKSAQKKKK